jgi:hypothetical protein
MYRNLFVRSLFRADVASAASTVRGFALPYLFSMRLHTEHVLENVKYPNTSSAEGESLSERNRSLWALHPRIYVTSYESVV